VVGFEVCGVGIVEFFVVFLLLLFVVFAALL
jgi:hypothetical protein